MENDLQILVVFYYSLELIVWGLLLKFFKLYSLIKLRTQKLFLFFKLFFWLTSLFFDFIYLLHEANSHPYLPALKF